jgi:Type I phosphodiesterase / nucleotide pyrophosphatase
MANKWKASILVGALALSSMPGAFAQPNNGGNGNKINHVLLLSIDGMHALDFENCENGISTINGGLPYCPNLSALGEHGVTYTGASTSKPSDSFPGLMSIVTGGSPRTMGIFYDVAYDRSLDPPAKTTGNGISAGACVAGAPATGTRTEYEEGISIDQSQLNGGAPGGADGGFLSLDPARMPRDPSKGCAPVYPWNFVRVNTVFGVIHGAGGYTAWSDKHPAYTSVSGPGDGTNVDDYYAPEINSPVVALPVTTPTGIPCTPIPNQVDTSDYTRGFENAQCYDTLKVNAILNEIDGKTHDGKKTAPVPVLYGMNFQAVSIGQKLIEKSGPTGGYQDAIGTPTNSLLEEIKFVDVSIGEMISHLKHSGKFESTLIIITAKHGQSPIDPNRFFPIPGTSGTNGQAPSDIIASLLPDSEVNQIGPTQDDLSLLWLKDSSQTSNAVAMLEANAASAGIGEIYAGPALNLLFNPPGLAPKGDPRSPDIFVESNIGVIYTGSARKLMEHGGFAHDDTNVMMLLSNPSFDEKTVNSFVETKQVAPTILKALGLDPNALQAVQIENTDVLPGLLFGE